MNDSLQMDRRPGLKPPQFRLLTLLLAMGLVGAILALGNMVGVYGAIWAVVFALAIIAHVAGNAMGLQLRESSPAGTDDADHPRHLPSRGGDLDAASFAPETKLRQRRSLGWLVVVVPLTTCLLFGALGGYWLARDTWHESTWMSIFCGLLACGTLGAIGGFLLTSFTKVLLSAVWEASRHR